MVPLVFVSAVGRLRSGPSCSRCERALVCMPSCCRSVFVPVCLHYWAAISSNARILQAAVMTIFKRMVLVLENSCDWQMAQSGSHALCLPSCRFFAVWICIQAAAFPRDAWKQQTNICVWATWPSRAAEWWPSVNKAALPSHRCWLVAIWATTLTRRTGMILQTKTDELYKNHLNTHKCTHTSSCCLPFVGNFGVCVGLAGPTLTKVANYGLQFGKNQGKRPRQP